MNRRRQDLRSRLGPFAFLILLALGVSGFGFKEPVASPSGKLQPTGDRPAGPAAFLQPGHAHHPPNSIVGRDAPDQIPDSTATSLLLRTMSDAKTRDAERGTQRFPAFLAYIEQSTGHSFNVFDRISLEAFASASVRGKRVSSAEDSWRALLARVNPESRKALAMFLRDHVKRNTKVLR